MEYLRMLGLPPGVADGYIFENQGPMPAAAVQLYEELAVIMEKIGPLGEFPDCDETDASAETCALCYMADLDGLLYTNILGLLLKFFAVVGPRPDYLRAAAAEGKATQK